MSFHIKIQVVEIFPSSGEEKPDEARKMYTMEMGARPTINALFASIYDLLKCLKLLHRHLTNRD